MAAGVAAHLPLRPPARVGAPPSRPSVADVARFRGRAERHALAAAPRGGRRLAGLRAEAVSGGGGGGRREPMVRHVPSSPAQRKPGMLTPLTALQRLVDECHSVFVGSNILPTEEVVSVICGMIDNIGPDDVALMDDARFSDEVNAAGCQSPPIITCKTIYECGNFTIMVFFLPRGVVMPLHDHPGMTVFSKLLVGSAHVVAYDWVHPPRVGPAVAGSVSGAMLAQEVLDNEFTAASRACVLFPNAGGNLHRIEAGEDGPCALLDVITPIFSPTSKTQERFSFYKDFPYELYPNVVEDDKVTQEQKHQLAWLQKIDEPEDLRFANLPYRGPPVV